MVSSSRSSSPERTKESGGLRPDLEVTDLGMILELLAGVGVGDEQRKRQLRHRCLELVIQALPAPDGATLPGPAPTWEELVERSAPPSATV
ncbi:MAG: hypothetical protein M3450_18485 [Actinomycetota bacterium]|nr:hypothetical protein [Actinomycetota bacterium]